MKSVSWRCTQSLSLNRLEELVQTIKSIWGGLDFIIHSIAFAPKNDLQGRVVDCSLDGFIMAMDISCYSLIRLVKAAEPLMTNGETIMTKIKKNMLYSLKNCTT